ncbi:MAG: ATP-binding cassette domain-containing protein [Spirochaetales bacterium]|nr:ATP-binding cassette domain-containing protein [Spirochaetales bacterium]
MDLELRDVHKSFGSVRAVDGLSFRTGAGRIFGLLGPNGAGKSTTIRMIMNIIAPDRGEILFDGQPIRPADKDRIGYLPEERGLYRKMVLNEALLYFASLKNLSRADAQPRIDCWLERFGLTEWKKNKVEELSKGMSQKVQFAVAVLHDPEVLFLDEPFAGLDPVSTESLREAVLELGRRGRTILLSTHIMDQAERMCGEILIIDRGREVLSGPVEALKARFGRNSVAIEFDGDAEIIRASGLVGNLISYPRWVEAELAEGATADELLKALAGRLSIKRFEVMAPSLHKIFIRQVGAREVQA